MAERATRSSATLPGVTPKTESLLAEALELDTDERARLATELIASLDGDPDMNWEEAWTAELDARGQAAMRISPKVITHLAES